MRGEVAREPARSEKIGENLAVGVTVVQDPPGRTVEPGYLGEHPQVAPAAPG